jgi:putative endonuclease
MSQGFMYILLCADGSYYTGSTNDLERRIAQHEAGEGANHTRKHGPVKLVYYEWFPRVDQAFYREKQVQGWSRKKKEALINGEFGKLPELAKAYRDIKALQALASSASANVEPPPEALEGSGSNETPNA